MHGVVQIDITDTGFGLQEAIAIVLDVGPSMNNAPPGEETPLQTAVDAIKMIIQRKVVQ